MWFLVFYVISVLMIRKLNFAVILSNKWLVKNKVSTLLHYYFWRNRQRHFFIILNCEWLFSKSPHCQCLKIKFKPHFSWLFHSGLSQQHFIIRKKLNMVSWHNFLASTLFKSCLDCFASFEIFLIFLVFHVTLWVLILKKWNFAVISSIKDKQIVKRLKFGSYCMINCGENDNDVFL